MKKGDTQFEAEYGRYNEMQTLLMEDYIEQNKNECENSGNANKKLKLNTKNQNKSKEKHNMEKIKTEMGKQGLLLTWCIGVYPENPEKKIEFENDTSNPGKEAFHVMFTLFFFLRCFWDLFSKKIEQIVASFWKCGCYVL